MIGKMLLLKSQILDFSDRKTSHSLKHPSSIKLTPQIYLIFRLKLLFRFNLPLQNMSSASDNASDNDPHSIYQFSAKTAEGNEVSFDKYKWVIHYFVICLFIFYSSKRGKVLLVVNVASQCGYTESNYTQLNELLGAYHDRGKSICKNAWALNKKPYFKQDWRLPHFPAINFCTKSLDAILIL